MPQLVSSRVWRQLTRRRKFILGLAATNIVRPSGRRTPDAVADLPVLLGRVREPRFDEAIKVRDAVVGSLTDHGEGQDISVFAIVSPSGKSGGFHADVGGRLVAGERVLENGGKCVRHGLPLKRLEK